MKFISALTCCNWFNLFELTNGYDLVYNWFEKCHEINYRISAYVIMPTHLHFIITTPFKNANLNKLISNGKRFIAYDLVERLRKQGNNRVLKILEDAVTPSDSRRGKLHQVFKGSFDARVIYDEKMLMEKLDYIHHNPVSGTWHLVEDW